MSKFKKQALFRMKNRKGYLSVSLPKRLYSSLVKPKGFPS